MDLKYLPQRRFQLAPVDDCGRFLAATGPKERRTTAAVCRALSGLLDTVPFPALHSDRQRLRARPRSHPPPPPSQHPLYSHPASLSSPQRQGGAGPAYRSGGVLGRHRTWAAGGVGIADSSTTSASTTGAVSTAPWATPLPWSTCPAGPACLTCLEALQFAATPSVG